MATFTNHKKAQIERYEKIYFSTKDRLIGFVKNNVHNQSVADDIIQECYIRLWEKLESIQDDHTVLVLLRKYAHNLIIDYVRRSAREALRHATYQQQQDETCTADNALLLKEMLQDYEDAIKTLPQKRRAIYRMVREEGLSHREIADKLNISTNTIEKHMNEALHTLRTHFPPDRLSLLLPVVMLYAMNAKW
ncbi:MAG: sigma-70 family RNA polymerase sigma factor [Chitinophagaceae bacterium]